MRRKSTCKGVGMGSRGCISDKTGRRKGHSLKNDIPFRNAVILLTTFALGLSVPACEAYKRTKSQNVQSKCIEKFLERIIENNIEKEIRRIHVKSDEDKQINDHVRLPLLQGTNIHPKCGIVQSNRYDCWPEANGLTELKCLQRGCCYVSNTKQGPSPTCYFPSNFPRYKVTGKLEKQRGMKYALQRSGTTFYGDDVLSLTLDVDYLSSDVLRVKFTDSWNDRFEPNIPLDFPTESGDTPLKYKVEVFEPNFNIAVTRISDGVVVFDTRTTAPLIFSDQYLQLGTQLTSPFLYGLGEHRGRFLHNLDEWKRLTFWTYGEPFGADHTNGYGAHPFFLNLDNTRKDNAPPSAHGVFLLNSNAAEAAIQPSTVGGDVRGSITYRTTGGILDLFVFLGPDPLSVVSQYQKLIGRPYFPPFHSLGFHLSKYGYKGAKDVQEVVKRNRDANMPYDVQWADIDYMDRYKDWTYDTQGWAELPDIIEDLHSEKQRFMVILDPAIPSDQAPGTYRPFEEGKDMDIFIKSVDNEIMIGKCWPGEVAFPDFFHPDSTRYWFQQAERFRKEIDFDGLWLDMNEPHSFEEGSTKGCTDNKWDNPPFTPPGLGGKALLHRTLCPSAKQHISNHYNLHNMYGWSETNVTRRVLDQLFPNKRTFLLSRSTFSGSGRVTAHWTGDNSATFSDMAYSISAVLNFNIFGIPQIGAEICGFFNPTTDELCTRWHQLGVFYGFMRNHGDLKSPPQDPAWFPSPTRDNIRKALQLRYRLLAVLYNGFFEAHIKGNPLVRPLFFMYPGTETIDEQIMWTDQLLVSPALYPGQTTVEAYIPKDRWFDFYTGQELTTTGQKVTLDAPIDHINVHIRGGSILPLLPVTERTDIAREQKFELTISPDRDGDASGFLFWDDGESADSISSGKFTYVVFSLNKNTFKSDPVKTGYKGGKAGVRLGAVNVAGVGDSPSIVLVNGVDMAFVYYRNTKVMSILNLDMNLLEGVEITW